MEAADYNYKDYPVFSGLQRPLELMGLRGRYILWASLTAGGGIIGFIIGFIAVGFIVGLAVLTLILAVGVVVIFLKQRKGLHSKCEKKGIFIFAHSRHIF